MLKRKSLGSKIKLDKNSTPHKSNVTLSSFSHTFDDDDEEDDDDEKDGDDDENNNINLNILPGDKMSLIDDSAGKEEDDEDGYEEDDEENDDLFYEMKSGLAGPSTQNETRLLDTTHNNNNIKHNDNNGNIMNNNIINENECRNDNTDINISEPNNDINLLNNDNTNNNNNFDDNNNENNKTYALEVELKDGKDLLIKDRCGTSDPYVKFKVNNKVVYKSCIIDKDLNPVWNENFLIPLKNLEDPITVQVYDYDLGPRMDDFMGQAYLEPSQLALSQPVELNLMLEAKKGSKKFSYMGYVRIKCTMMCLDDMQLAETRARLESWKLRSHKDSVSSDKTKRSIKKRFKNEPIGTLNVLLVEGVDLIPMDDNGFSDPYVKFQLGQEKFKSKCKVKTLNPRWLESFDFDWWSFDQSELEISVYDHDVGGRDDILGRAKLDIRAYEPNKTHHLNVDLEDGAGHILLLLTLCPYQHPNIHSQHTISPQSTLLQQIKQLPQQQQQQYRSLVHHLDYFSFLDDHDLKKEIENLNSELAEKYNFMNSLKGFGDVGKMIITIHQARDLVAADLGGKSDPYCVIELTNSRLQTSTVYKSLNPRWRATYILDVADVHDCLEVTVYDYDKSKRSEFLGRIVIPLLRIRTNVKKWYMLKDKKLTQVTRGAVQLQLSVHYNPVKAVIRTFNPREEKLLVSEKAFKLGVLKSNTDRVFRLMEGMVGVSNFVNGCFDWKEKIHGSIAFVAFVVVVWNAELYMLPIAVVLLLFKNLVVLHYSGKLFEEEEPQVGSHEDKYGFVREYVDQDKKEGDNYKKLKDDKKGSSLRERLQSIQDVCLQVQETMDAVACVGERVKNTFLWKVPWLSILAVLTMLTISFILYIVPLRLIVLAWGINRFTRKYRVGDRVPNNEVLDFLSRVPSDNELVEYRELKES